MCFGASSVKSVKTAAVEANEPEQTSSQTSTPTGENNPNRLQAAEQTTGFKLGDIVATSNEDFTGNSYGKVVGFARVNTSEGEGIRHLVVEIDGSLNVILPSDADFQGRLQA
jgi:hypothetical protein